MNLYEAIKDKEINGKELARIAANQVNSFCRQEKVFNEIVADEETYEEFKAMSVAFIKSLATANKESFLHDGRNEYACRIASIIMSYEGINILDNLTSWDGDIVYTLGCDNIRSWEIKKKKKADRAGEFALMMSNEHRTLQQSFAELAFECISMIMKEDSAFVEYMEKNTGHYWNQTPMI